MPIRLTLFFLLLCSLVPQFAVAAEVETDEELYGEQGAPAYKSSGKEWQEQDVQLPAYPDDKKLIKVDLGIDRLPFTLLIDPRSLVVGDDRVVRFTAVLRSPAGVDNIEYQGIRCPQRMVRRYAWGDRGHFSVLPNSQWRYILTNVQDHYLDVLLRDFLCPLPGYNREKTLLRKLKRPNPANSFHGEDE